MGEGVALEEDAASVARFDRGAIDVVQDALNQV
jgi:hypothetical protein